MRVWCSIRQCIECFLQISKLSSSSVHVKAKVTCVARNPREDRTLLACENGTLLLFDEYRKTTRVFNINLVGENTGQRPGLVVSRVLVSGPL